MRFSWYDKHVVSELLPVSALLPQGAWHQLWSLDLKVSEATHVASDVIFKQLVDAISSRVPVHHSGGVLLNMIGVELLCEGSMIVGVHEDISCLSFWV
jgi:hypothetical protein